MSKLNFVSTFKGFTRFVYFTLGKKYKTQNPRVINLPLVTISALINFMSLWSLYRLRVTVNEPTNIYRSTWYSFYFFGLFTSLQKNRKTFSPSHLVFSGLSIYALVYSRFSTLSFLLWKKKFVVFILSLSYKICCKFLNEKPWKQKI